MHTPSSQAYAALILPDMRQLEEWHYAACARAALSRLEPDQPVELLASDIGTCLANNTALIRLRSIEDGEFGPCVEARVSALTEEVAPGVLDQVLRRFVRSALVICDADYVEWQQPGLFLDRAEFAALPLRSANETTLPDLARDTPPWDIRGPLLEPDADAPLSAPCAKERRLKAASWLMTGMVATLSLPVGAALYVHSAGRGCDLRRVTQALAICALFSVLQAQGALAGSPLEALF